MDAQQLAAIEARHHETWYDGPCCWACSDNPSHHVAWPCDAAVLVAEVRRLRTMETRYRAHLARIRARWADADGTPLVGEWGLPWAMADDAQTVLEETPEQPCPACH